MRININHSCFWQTVGFNFKNSTFLYRNTSYLVGHPELKEIGLRVVDNHNVIDYTFDVIDEHKFFLSSIKYGIVFEEI